MLTLLAVPSVTVVSKWKESESGIWIRNYLLLRNPKFHRLTWAIFEPVKSSSCFRKIFSMAQQSPVGQCLLVFEISRSHSGKPRSVGLLWTSDQPDAETSTWKTTVLTRDIHAPGGIQIRNPSKLSATDLRRLRPRDHWNRLQQPTYL